MIHPFKQIEKAENAVNNLKFKLQYSRNKKRDAKDINNLIKTVKMFDSLLVHKYKTDVIDVLICYIIKDYLMRYSVEGTFKDGLPLNQIISKIDFSLDWNSNLAIQSLSSQIYCNIVQGNLEYDKKTALDKMSKLPKIEDIELLVKELLIEFKQQIRWKK